MDEMYLDIMGRSISNKPHIVHDKDVKLETNPHYTNSKFDTEQTVFGKPSTDKSRLYYEYSDRLWQWDYDKAQSSIRKANETKLVPHSCLWYECYLSHYHNQDVSIEHIVAGVNRSNGYGYCAFGFIFTNPPNKE